MLGQHRVSGRADSMLVTTLGSCVAACIRDPAAGIGGMNHFLLPNAPAGDNDRFGSSARYGSVAMERLINAILTHGGARERLEVKLFGGGRITDTHMDIGAANAVFVLDYVEREGLNLVSQDLGGTYARKIIFFPTTGRALRRLIRPERLSDAVHAEAEFLSTLRATPIEGEVELF